jgi:hypothetical protein
MQSGTLRLRYTNSAMFLVRAARADQPQEQVSLFSVTCFFFFISTKFSLCYNYSFLAGLTRSADFD